MHEQNKYFKRAKFLETYLKKIKTNTNSDFEELHFEENNEVSNINLNKKLL